MLRRKYFHRARQAILNHRNRVKTRCGRRLYGEVLALLFRHDPIGLNFGVNADEYDPEVRTILPRLHEATSVDDVCRIVHEEFVRWFDCDAGKRISPGIAGPQSRYQELAAELWVLWQQQGL